MRKILIVILLCVLSFIGFGAGNVIINPKYIVSISSDYNYNSGYSISIHTNDGNVHTISFRVSYDNAYYTMKEIEDYLQNKTTAYSSLRLIIIDEINNTITFDNTIRNKVISDETFK